MRQLLALTVGIIDVPPQHLISQLSHVGRVQADQCRNLTIGSGGHFITTAGGAAPTPLLQSSEDPYLDGMHILYSLPRSSLLTEDEIRKGVVGYFINSPQFQKHLSDENIQAIPASFISALFFLYHLHSAGTAHAEPLWQAWAAHNHATTRTATDALYRWTEEELDRLEEKRLADSARQLRSAADVQYDRLFLPLARAFPRFFNWGEIRREDYLSAVGVALCQSTPVDGIQSDVLQPLPLRQYPSLETADGAASFGSALSNLWLEEVEQELRMPDGSIRQRSMVNLVTRRATPLEAGAELILSGRRRNDDLLLHCGYLWDDLRSASVPLRMRMAYGASQVKGEAALRAALLAKFNLNETSDFVLTHGSIPPKLEVWSRIHLALDEEIRAAMEQGGGRTAFEQPMSVQTKEQVYHHLLRSLTSMRSEYEHDVAEDEMLLGEGSSKVARKARRDPGLLSVRAELAVRHRRLSKLVLEDAIERVSNSLQSATREREAEGVEPSPDSKSPPYSTARERKRRDKEQREKERKRESVRKRRAAVKVEEAKAEL